MKVSIVVTIYNREKYLKDCVCSIFEQTLDELEYIFVDDASTDNSLAILDGLVEKYPYKKPFLKIIRLEKNGGRAIARQIGVDNASGEYIIHVDSDDWVDKDMLELLYTKAKETNADIVGCNIMHEYANSQCVFKQAYSDEMDENIRRLLNGKIFPSLCTSLTRTNLIKNNKIFFPKGIDTGEDLLFNLQLYLYAQKVIGIDAPSYHYRHTEDSGSFQHTQESVNSVIEVARRIDMLMKETGNYEKYINEILFRKFSLKCALIERFDNKENNKTWLSLFPETHQFIWSFKQYNWKQRIEFWLAAHNLFFVASFVQNMLNSQYAAKQFLCNYIK